MQGVNGVCSIFSVSEKLKSRYATDMQFSCITAALLKKSTDGEIVKLLELEICDIHNPQP